MHIAYNDENERNWMSTYRRGQEDRQWALKPQDLAVALKLLVDDSQWVSYKHFAGEMYLSQFEAHAAVKRLEHARLIVIDDRAPSVIRSALKSFLLYGAQYAFPAVFGNLANGMKTSYAAKPLSDEILAGTDPIPVWPMEGGKDRGVAILPLYAKLPLAAKENSGLYRVCASFDALRSGRARERALAKKVLTEALAAA